MNSQRERSDTQDDKLDEENATQDFNTRENKVRKNGLEPPFELLQILTWLLLAVMVGGYYGLIIPILEKLYLRIIMGILFAGMVAVAVVAAYMACKIDPADDGVLGMTPIDPQTSAGRPDKVMCNICKATVSRSSKHCKFCEKCVDDFDHHCKWLNNCIGKKNYRHFLILLVGTFCFTIVELAMFINNAAQFFVDRSKYEDRVELVFGEEAIPLAFLVMTWVFIAMLTPVAGLLGQLLHFHITLVKEGLTTYDFIIREQTLARQEEAQRAEASRSGEREQGFFKMEGLCCPSSASLEGEDKIQSKPDEQVSNGKPAM